MTYIARDSTLAVSFAGPFELRASMMIDAFVG